MPKSSNQKQKLLYLQKILLEKTDEEHALSMTELIRELEHYDIQASRKSVYDDMEILQHFGLDICRIRSRTTRYYIGNRDFQIPELKLLVDAIQSSKFITPKKSMELIAKLEHLVSEHEGRQLQRQVTITNRVKTVNERIYYNVDRIHNAISANRRISFTYFRWEVDFDSPQRYHKVARKNGAPYIVSPWALCWEDENYYLIAYDSDAGIIKHYRVDKMENIGQTEEERDGSDTFERFNLAHYAKSVFSMFGGEETTVRLLVKNEAVGVIIDRFGGNVHISRHSAQDFTINVSVVLSPQFYAWVFGMDGKIKILAPELAVIGFRDKIRMFIDSD